MRNKKTLVLAPQLQNPAGRDAEPASKGLGLVAGCQGGHDPAVPAKQATQPTGEVDPESSGVGDAGGRGGVRGRDAFPLRKQAAAYAADDPGVPIRGSDRGSRACKAAKMD